jgi:hypothetical protein
LQVRPIERGGKDAEGGRDKEEHDGIHRHRMTPLVHWEHDVGDAGAAF